MMITLFIILDVLFMLAFWITWRWVWEESKTQRDNDSYVRDALGYLTYKGVLDKKWEKYAEDRYSSEEVKEMKKFMNKHKEKNNG